MVTTFSYQDRQQTLIECRLNDDNINVKSNDFDKIW